MKPKKNIKRIKDFLGKTLPSPYTVAEVSYESVPGMGYYIAIGRDGLFAGANFQECPTPNALLRAMRQLIFNYEKEMKATEDGKVF